VSGGLAKDTSLLDLEVRDPVALHTIAALILAAKHDGAERDSAAS